MKKFLFSLTLLFVGFMAFLPKSTANVPSTPPVLASPASIEEDVIGVYIEITFGRKRKDCEGRGWCKVKFGVDLDLKAPTGGGVGSGDFVNGQFVVDFVKSSMDETTLTQHFGDGSFVVGEAFEFDAKDWGGTTHTIAAGTYTVEDLGDVLRVVFN